MFGISRGCVGGGAQVMLMVQPCKLLNISLLGIAKLDNCGSVALVDGP